MTWDQFESLKKLRATKPLEFPKMSLAEHDRVYHPTGFKDGCKCKLRSMFNSYAKADKIEGPEEVPMEEESQETASKCPAFRAVDAMRRLATKWHTGAYRRGADRLPYIVHPTAVVAMLKQWGFSEEHNPVTMGVAWGHDLIEDTNVSENDIINAGNTGDANLGNDILNGIRTLSFDAPEDPTLTKEEKDKIKDAYLQKVADTATPDILVVKIADRLCNSLDFYRDRNPWGKTYLAKGDRFFSRVDELPFSEKIKESIEEVKHQVGEIPDYKKPDYSSNTDDDSQPTSDFIESIMNNEFEEDDQFLPSFEYDEEQEENNEESK